MSLYQCEECGCIENTAMACQGMKGYAEKFFDWKGFEDRKGKLLCSACGPTKYADGNPTEYGKWHDQFKRRYLPLGEFETCRVGNLRHKVTGDTEYSKYLIEP